MNRSENSNTSGILQVPFRPVIPGKQNILLLLFGGVSLTALLYLASHTTDWRILPFYAILFALLGGMVFSLLHEATHGVFHKNKKINALGGIIAALFFPTSYTLQKISHLGYHQRNRTDVERFDLYKKNENVILKYIQWYGVLTGLYWFLAPLSCLVILTIPRLLKWKVLRNPDSPLAGQTSADAMIAPLLGPELKWIRWQALFALSFHIALIFLLGVHPLIWLLLFFSFGLSWSSLQYATHSWSPLDIQTGAWNLRVFPPIRWMSLNYHHHLTHHLYPHVPWNQLGRLTDPTAPRPSFLQIYLSMWKGPRPIERAHELYEREIKKARSGEKKWIQINRILAISISFGILFYLGYFLSDLVSGLYATRLDLSFDFEKRIPFLPWMSAIYLSLNGLFLLLPLQFNKPKKLFPIAVTFSLQLLIAIPFFLLLPLANTFEHQIPSSMAGLLYNLADMANLRYNDFPSLHVTFSWTAAVLLSMDKGFLSKLFFTIWALAITASTLLIHAHHIIDIPGGILLAFIGLYFIYPRLKSEHFIRAWKIEWICLKENLRFIKRNKRYLSVFLTLYFASPGNWNRRRGLRAGYCLIQHIDDVYDGDRPIANPEDYINKLWEPDPEKDPYSREMGDLATFVIDELKAKSSPEEYLLHLFFHLVNVMHFDYLRRKHRVILKKEELDKQHTDTFSISMDLTLALYGSRLRSSSLPEMVKALSWVSPARDLKDDWRNGIINIPLEILQKAYPNEIQKGKDFILSEKRIHKRAPLLDQINIFNNPVIQSWIREEYKNAEITLSTLKEKISDWQEKKTRPYIWLFYKAIHLYHKRFNKLNEFHLQKENS